MRENAEHEPVEILGTSSPCGRSVGPSRSVPAPPVALIRAAAESNLALRDELNRYQLAYEAWHYRSDFAGLVRGTSNDAIEPSSVA